ncbi:MAG: hypothetical protein Q8Q32_02305 [bacterium]|nr:hypothetical protein [bacterium]
MQPELVPQQRPEPVPEKESIEKRGFLSSTLKKKIADYARMYRKLTKASESVPDHKFTKININVRRSVIQAIQSEHKNFNARPDERDEDWIDDLLKMEPSAIEAFQIKVPETSTEALEYEEPKEPQEIKARPQPKKPADEGRSGRPNSNKPKRVRKKDAHIMQAAENAEADESEPEVEKNPPATTEPTKEPADKNPEPAPSLGGSGGDEPPEGPPEDEAKAEKREISRALQHYEKVESLIKVYENKGDNITREDVDELIDKIYNLEDVLGLDIQKLERDDSDLADIYRIAKSRIEFLKDKVRKKERASQETKTHGNESTPEARRAHISKTPGNGEGPEGKGEKLPSVVEVLSKTSLRHNLEDYRDAIIKFNEIGKRANVRRTALEGSKAEIFFADQRFAEAISEEFNLDLSIENPRYQKLRDEALEELRKQPRFRLMSEQEQERYYRSQGVSREILDRRARERDLARKRREGLSDPEAEKEANLENAKFQVGQKVYILDINGKNTTPTPVEVISVSLDGEKIMYAFKGVSDKFEENRITDKNPDDSSYSPDLSSEALAKLDTPDKSNKTYSPDTPDKFDKHPPDLEEKLQRALQDDAFTEARPPELLTKGIESEADQKAFVASWEAFNKKEQVTEDILSFCKSKLDPLNLKLPSDRVEALKEKVNALVWENPEEIENLAALLKEEGDRAERIKSKEEEIESLLAQFKKSEVKAEELHQGSKEAFIRAKDQGFNPLADYKEGIRDKTKRSLKAVGGFFFAVKEGLKSGNVGQEIKKTMRALRMRRMQEGEMSPKELYTYLGRTSEKSIQERNKKSRLEADLNTAKKAFEDMKARALSEFEPIKEAKEMLKRSATTQLQNLINGDFRSLERANEYLKELQGNSFIDYFGPDSKEYIDTREARQDGSPKTKDKIPTRLGVALTRPEEIQREINFRITGEVTSMLENKIDQLSNQKAKFKELENLLKDTLETPIGSKTKENSKELLSKILDMKINTFSHDPEKNSALVLKLKGLQLKYLK